MRKVIFGIALVFLAYSCASTGGGRRGGSGGTVPTIRVLLADKSNEVTVSASGGFSVRSPEGILLLHSATTGSIRLSGSFPSLTVEGDTKTAVADHEIIIVADDRSSLGYGGVQYAGQMRAFFGHDGKLVLTNELSLETYLEGVLPQEIGNPGPDGYDAVKSQAIAARTYALGKMKDRKSEYFDVHATILDQAYMGLKGVNRNSSSAVKDTRGQVLDYGGATVKAYYSACCGGHTSDIRKMWPDREPADYLKGTQCRSRDGASSFCNNNRYFRWRYSFTGKELGEVLRVTIPRRLGVSEEGVGSLRDIRVVERTPSGRVLTLMIHTSKNDFVVHGDQIRWILMADIKTNRILPSALFRLDKVMERDQVAFVSIVGGGNGHGVGMCQNGAIGMARKGYTYKMILSHYYPACTIEKAY